MPAPWCPDSRCACQRQRLSRRGGADTPCDLSGQATERFKKRQIPGPKPYYSTHEWPSLWFEPTEVWEVRALQCNVAFRGAVQCSLCAPSVLPLRITAAL